MSKLKKTRTRTVVAAGYRLSCAKIKNPVSSAAARRKPFFVPVPREKRTAVPIYASRDQNDTEQN